MASLIKQYVDLTNKYQKLVDQHRLTMKEKNDLWVELENYKRLHEHNCKTIEVLKQKLEELTNTLEQSKSVETPVIVEESVEETLETPVVDEPVQEVVEEQPKTQIEQPETVDEVPENETNVEETPVENTDTTLWDSSESEVSTEQEVVEETPVKKTRKPRKSKKKTENNED